MKVHAAAALFPMLDDEELKALAEDIRDNGLTDPLIVWHPSPGEEAILLDGRNRLTACEFAGVSPDWETFEGAEDEVVRYIVSKNIHRRHLSDPQRSMVGAKLATLQAGINQYTLKGAADRPDLPADNGVGGIPQREVADLLNVSERSLRRAVAVDTKGVEELKDAVMDGDIALTVAEQIAKLPEEAQRSRVAAIFSSKSVEWYTPAEYVDAAREVMGKIDLDPGSCEEANKTVKAAKIYTEETDGLAEGNKWKGRLWLNPHGRLAGQFVSRLMREVEAENVKEFCILLNSYSSDTQWWQPLWDFTLSFPSKRINFTAGEFETENGSTHGSVIVYYGPNRARFIEVFSKFGVIMERVTE
jgi:ParB-like chromosome segregation protein Spo0J